MALTADTAIVTAAEVAALTNEATLTGPDEGDATLANLLPQATNWLMRVVKARGMRPDLVTNTSDLKQIAAYWIAWRYWGAKPQGEEAIQKVHHYREALEGELANLTVETSDANARTVQQPAAPFSVNLDSHGIFTAPRDTGGAPCGVFGPWKTSIN